MRSPAPPRETSGERYNKEEEEDEGSLQDMATLFAASTQMGGEHGKD